MLFRRVMIVILYFVYVCSLSYCILSSTLFFFFKQKTAYEMRISDWSSDVCSSDLADDFNDEGFEHRAGAYASKRFGDFDFLGSASYHKRGLFSDGEIGRASCRERVCQYV